MNVVTEDLILKNLLINKDFCRHIISFIQPDWFEHHSERKIFDLIQKFYNKYRKPPTTEIMKIYFRERDKSITSESQLESINNNLDHLEKLKVKDYDLQWLLDETEEWGKDRGIFNALGKSIDYYNNKPKEKIIIPNLLIDALKISLDQTVGHEYLQETEKRFDKYKSIESRYPTHLRDLNRMIGGGFKRKTINVILGRPGSGKTRILVDLAAHYLSRGLNVLYITLEISEHEISKRMDANLFDYDINALEKMNKTTFNAHIQKIKKKTEGRLFVKEWPTSSVNTNHIRSFLNELKIKKDFKPDIIVVDYLTILLSVRGGRDNSLFTYGKYVAEELRGLAVETDTLILSGAQTNRGGWDTTNVEMSHTAESAGIPSTADFLAVIITNSELRNNNQVMFKVLKNRLFKLDGSETFILNYSDEKMRHYDSDDVVRVNTDNDSEDSKTREGTQFIFEDENE